MANNTDASFGVVPVCLGRAAPLFLVVRHRAGHWGFPKGHAEPGEDALTTARRELAEETGLRDVEILDAPPIREHYQCRKKGRQKDKTVTFFVGVATMHELTLQAAEISDAAWLTEAAAAGRLTYDTGRETLAAAARLTRRLAEG